MKLITQRDLIQGVATRWDQTYRSRYGTSEDRPFNGKTKEQISNGLHALDPNTASPDDVEKVIGNGSWTRLVCDECEKESDSVVQVGDEPEYESSTAYLCRKCAQLAADSFTNP